MTNMLSRAGEFVNLFSPHLHGGRSLSAGVRAEINSWLSRNIGGQRLAVDGSLVREKGLRLPSDGGAELRRRRRAAARKRAQEAAKRYGAAVAAGQDGKRLWGELLAMDAAARRYGRDDDPSPQRSVATPLTVPPEASGRALDVETYLKGKLSEDDFEEWQRLREAGRDARLDSRGLVPGSALARDFEERNPGTENIKVLGGREDPVPVFLGEGGQSGNDRRHALDHLDHIRRFTDAHSDGHDAVQPSQARKTPLSPLAAGKAAALAHDEARRDRDFERRFPGVGGIRFK